MVWQEALGEIDDLGDIEETNHLVGPESEATTDSPAVMPQPVVGLRMSPSPLLAPLSS